MKTIHWLLVVLSAVIVLNFTRLIYFNIFTHSLPYGIYMKIDSIPQRDDYAASCLTPQIAQYGIDRKYLVPGMCDTGSVLVLKKIKGLPGDRYAVKNKFLELNGHSYHIMDHDSSGRSLGLFYGKKEGLIDKGSYFLLSDFVENSWDSRYWGPVSVQFLLKPLWIFEK